MGFRLTKEYFGMLKRFLLITTLTLLFVFPAPSAFAFTARPALDGNAEICHVPVGGGSCVFTAGVDGCVDFPDAAKVTSHVYVGGGKTVWIGCDLDGESGVGGHIELGAAINVALSINVPTTNALYFVEGLHIDASNWCDGIAIREHNENQFKVTVQNTFIEGMGYNTIPGCHGDTIQFQVLNDYVSPGGVELVMENVASISNGQGIFIPDRSTGTTTATLENVFVKVDAPPQHFAQLFFWSAVFAPLDPEYPVTLTNVWVEDPINHILPPCSNITAGICDFTTYATITGVVNVGFSPENAFVTYPLNTGLNYDRAFFIPGPTDPPPVDPPPGPVSATNIANLTTYDSDSGNFDVNNPVEGLWDGCVDGTAPCSPGKAGETSFWVVFDLGANYDLDSARIFGDADGSWISETWDLEYDEEALDGWTAAFTGADASDNDWFDAADLTAIDNVRWIRFTAHASASVQVREFELEATLADVPPPSTRLVTSPDASDDATNITLSNEIKGDLNALIAEYDALVADFAAFTAHVHTTVIPHGHTDPAEITAHDSIVHLPDSNHTHDFVSLQKQYTWCLRNDTLPACADFLPPE
jgi:hypothetical protein